MTDREFATKLKKAVGNGDITAIRRIIKGGVDLNVKCHYWYNSSLLHEAIASGNVPIIKLLIQSKIDVNTANEDGRTALHLASRAGNAEIVKELIKSGANVNAKTSDGRTPLHISIWRGKSEVVCHLVEAGAHVNQHDDDGWTPLYWASKLNYLDTAKILVEHGAKLNHKVKRSTDSSLPFARGMTALHVAVEKGHIPLAMYLVQQGAEIDTKSNDVLRLMFANKHLSVESLIKLLNIFHVHGFCIRGNPLLHIDKIPERYSKHQEFTDWLTHKSQQVSPLCNLCRIRIRQRLSYCHHGVSITRKLDRLQLPTQLVDYLSFENDNFDDTS